VSKQTRSQFRKWLRGWTWYPELERFQSEREAKTAFRKCYSAWRFGLMAGVICIPAQVVADFSEPQLGMWGRNLVFVIAYTAFMIPVISIQIRKMRIRLREELTSRGVPVCIPCGYDLRGQTEPRCPECGTSFDPALLDENEKNPTNGSDES
jgi:hypothetical protein